MTTDHWAVSLSEAAEEDVRQIIRWTTSEFGARQADLYDNAIRQVLKELRGGPAAARAALRRIGGRELFILRPKLGKRRAAHVLVLQVTGDHWLTVLRILHERMDLPRHLPPG